MVSACGGGNPFTTTTDDDTDTGTDTESAIPASIANDLDSVSYDPTNQTLTVTGVGLDETPFTSTYVRKPALDRAGYEAYTVQDNELTEHSTAYVRQSGRGYAAVVVTGGQFGYFQGGATYARTGSFTEPDTESGPGGIVSYAGNYVGLLNVNGDTGDLIIPSGSPETILLPGQAAEVTGDVFINADFSDRAIKGTIYNREITDAPGTSVENLILVPTEIAADGTFDGTLNVDGTGVGTYGGTFAGTDAEVVAGGVHATSHIDALSGGTNPIEEYGVFVLDSCDSANADPVCP
ncbi:thymidylate synthase [Leisingera sp. ANG-M6]|uniref:thymidylate synthase n=1 Tax=Leisingera sp. ANG-M6 TaxID=1577900 RepID=UPI000A5F7CC4